MKKLLSSIASIATGVLTFVFLSIPCFVTKITVAGVTTSESASGWELLKEEASIEGYTLFKIFAIVALIIACLLIISGLITLLQQLGIVKSKLNFCLINSILLALYTISSVVAMIGVIIMGNKTSLEVLGQSIASGVGIGIILMLVVGAIATIISFIFSRQKK